MNIFVECPKGLEHVVIDAARQMAERLDDGVHPFVVRVESQMPVALAEWSRDEEER